MVFKSDQGEPRVHLLQISSLIGPLLTITPSYSLSHIIEKRLVFQNMQVTYDSELLDELIDTLWYHSCILEDLGVAGRYQI